ncbi:hypothetical protein ABZ671_18535 [Micromonospora sp. NPDC006766]|uniref:hypothetical protein n=1 Tax=Micromonospora sp. NPDC006766 TaxID=3154778 RepID=UPI0033C3FE24
MTTLHRRPRTASAPHRYAVTAAVLAAGAVTLAAVAPEPVAATKPPTRVLLIVQPTVSAAAAIYLTDGSIIEPAPIGREIEFTEQLAGVQIFLRAPEGGVEVSQPGVDLPLRATAAFCAIVIDGRVVDQSGPADLASCRWDR